MKLGMLAASLSRDAGGVGVALRSLSLALHDDPRLAIKVFGLRDARTEQDLPQWSPLSVSVLPVTARPRSFGYASGLSGSLREAKLDMLHLHGLWMYPSVAGLRWSMREDKLHMVSPHGMLDPWSLANSRWKKRIAAWLFEWKGLRRAGCLHALCPAEAASMRALGLTNPICIVPNGVDDPVDAPPPPPWAGDLPADARVLLYLGRLHPKKNLARLLVAWNATRLRGGPARDWHLVIAGWDQNGHGDELRRMCRDMGARGVHFVGPQFDDQKEGSFAAAHGFVLPSLSEGLPMAVLEAWSYGLPVIMTAACNLPEGFAAGAAIQVDPTVPSISEGLGSLFALSEGDRLRMGQDSRRLVRQRFSWPAVAERMMQVYVWLHDGGAAPDCVEPACHRPRTTSVVHLKRRDATS